MNILDNLPSIVSLPVEYRDSPNSERHHREVIYLLEKKLTSNPKCVQSLREWITSYHELASIHQQKGELETAQKCLLIPHQSMLYMADNNNGDEDIELIAIKAINTTLPPLLEFAKVYPPCENCMQKLRSQLAIINNDDTKYH